MIAGHAIQRGRFPVFVVSLKLDIERRVRLRRRFGEAYDTFNIVDGVDLRGSELPLTRFHPRAWRDPHQVELARRQVGCAMSHVRALEKFLCSDAERGIVLEDDVEGDIDDLSSAEQLLEKLPPDSFVLLGGQEGLRGRRYLSGVKVTGLDAWRLPSASTRFTARAVAYAVTRPSAELILSRQRKCLDHPDHWSALLRGWRNVFFSEIFRHPVDLQRSHMESARIVAKARPVLVRLFEDGVWETVLRNVSKCILPTIWPVFGVSRIPVQRRLCH